MGFSRQENWSGLPLKRYTCKPIYELVCIAIRKYLLLLFLVKALQAVLLNQLLRFTVLGLHWSGYNQSATHASEE